MVQRNKFDFKLVADWHLFELIIFNSIYNSVKYNKPIFGEIVFILTCKPRKANVDYSKEINKQNSRENENYENYILEVEIVDTGVGIEQHR